MAKRKPRKVMAKKIDLLKPVTLEMLGTDDDPCFAKLYDPREGACQRCGDNEICALAMGQRTHLKRKQVEAKQDFKDLEEKTIKPMDKTTVKKDIKKRIRSIVRLAGPDGITKDGIVHDIFSSYHKDGITKKTIRILIDKVVDKSSTISLKQNKYVYENR